MDSTDAGNKDKTDKSVNGESSDPQNNNKGVISTTENIGNFNQEEKNKTTDEQDEKGEFPSDDVTAVSNDQESELKQNNEPQQNPSEKEREEELHEIEEEKFVNEESTKATEENILNTTPDMIGLIETDPLVESDLTAQQQEEILYFYQLSQGFYKENNFLNSKDPIRFGSNVSDTYICNKCQFILWNPLQLKCGHTICNSCRQLNHEAENETTFKCPFEDELMNQDESKILTDKQMEIEQLSVYCLEKPCIWSGHLQELAAHHKLCDMKQTICNGCNQIILEKEMENHLLECENRTIVCEYCSQSAIWKEHQSSCTMKAIPCPNGCKLTDQSEEIIEIKQSELEHHLTYDCPERKVPCQFSDYKCDKKLKWRKMPQHLKKYSIIHLNDLCPAGHDYLKLLETQSRMLLDIKEQVKRNGRIIAEMSANVAVQLLWRIDNIKEKYQIALSGTNTDVVSEPFFSTNPYGYKFILRLVFNVTNPRISQQYMSLLISICDNPFNVLLEWPFKQKINFHLVNQESDKHISHVLTPNPIKENFPFLNKPTGDRNPFFGIEKFAKCSIFHDRSPFVVDDTIFLKVVVEPHEVA